MTSSSPPPQTTPSDSDSGKETVTTVTVPNGEPVIVTGDGLTAQASPPLVCIFRFVGDSAAGAAMGSVFGYGNFVLSCHAFCTSRCHIKLSKLFFYTYFALHESVVEVMKVNIIGDNFIPLLSTMGKLYYI